MAARSLQVLSQALRRARVSVRSSPTIDELRFVSLVAGGPCLSSASFPGWTMGSSKGIFHGCCPPVCLTGFTTVGAYTSGSLAAPHWRWRGIGSVPYSSLALETREDSVINGAEIGYKVLGPYVPEGAKIQPQAAFAVVQVGSHQFKVTPGDMIYTEKLKHADINDQLSLDKVLLLGSLKQTIIGRPIIPEAAVIAAVEEHALDAKVIIFKKKRRKNYRRTNGHRQELTRLRILRIEGIEDTTLVWSKSSGEDTD